MPGVKKKKPYTVGKGKPPKHSQWKKGQSGNPSGKPPDPPEFKLMQRLTKAELADLGSLLLKRDLAGLMEILREAKEAEATFTECGHSVLKVMVAAVCSRILRKGDMHTLDKLLDRLLGKVTQGVEWKGDAPPVNAASIVNIVLPPNGKEAK